MVVGTKNVDIKELEARLDDIGELLRYVRSLVPAMVRKNKQIVDNQMYLAACYLRRGKADYYKRQKAIQALTEHITVTGLVDAVTEFSDILNEADMVLIDNCLKEEQDGYSS